MTGAILTANFRKQFPGGPEIGTNALRIGGGITMLFGESGSGKTTILRCLAGLETPNDGEITFGNVIWFQKSGKRKVEIFFCRRENAGSVLCRRITRCFRISRSLTTLAMV